MNEEQQNMAAFVSQPVELEQIYNSALSSHACVESLYDSCCGALSQESATSSV